MLKAGQVTGLWCPAGHVLLCNLVIFVARLVRQGACGHSGTRFFEAWAYLFLWFDPNHYGHCYGYHIIPSSEGRKDPFASCFLHMANPPDEIFYDFACQLEEYCLNREPQFFLKTRFWHDIFHGYSHKCPPVYRSNRIQSLNHLNTEICEQFNSFIQRIKHSARSMSASRFSFFLQFMIHQWNERKRMKFEQQCKVAAQFLQ